MPVADSSRQTLAPLLLHLHEMQQAPHCRVHEQVRDSRQHSRSPLHHPPSLYFPLSPEGKIPTVRLATTTCTELSVKCAVSTSLEEYWRSVCPIAPLYTTLSLLTHLYHSLTHPAGRRQVFPPGLCQLLQVWAQFRRGRRHVHCWRRRLALGLRQGPG